MNVRALCIAAMCACASPSPPAIQNAVPSAAKTCSPPSVLTFSAKRSANLDLDHPEYGKWTPWTVLLVRHDATRASVTMRGDDLTWTFDARGTLDCSRIDITFATHDPMSMQLDLATRTGTIRSIDDTWELY